MVALKWGLGDLKCNAEVSPISDSQSGSIRNVDMQSLVMFMHAV